MFLVAAVAFVFFMNDDVFDADAAGPSAVLSLLWSSTHHVVNNIKRYFVVGLLYSKRSI